MPQQQWDPVLIVYQIIAVQCFYYLALGSLLALSHVVIDVPVSLEHFFQPKLTHFSSLSGWSDCTCMLLSGIAGAYILSFVVERSKKCVDFTATLYLLHLGICSYFHHFPTHWEWWVVNAVAAAGMAALGEYLCALNELQEIPLYSNQESSMI